MNRSIYERLKAMISYQTPPEMQELLTHIEHQRETARDLTTRVERLEDYTGLSRAIDELTRGKGE